MSRYEIFANIWWAFVVIVVGALEYRLGRKIGRREGYVEGHRHGTEDSLRRVNEHDERAKVRLVEAIRIIGPSPRGGWSRRGKPS